MAASQSTPQKWEGGGSSTGPTAGSQRRRGVDWTVCGLGHSGLPHLPAGAPERVHSAELGLGLESPLTHAGLQFSLHPVTYARASRDLPV